MSRFPKETEIIIEAVKDAMKITEWFQNEGFKIYKKQDSTPVTHADLASQILIVSRIKKHFPDDMIIAEEDQEFIDETTNTIIKQCFRKVGLDDSFNVKKLISFKGNDPNRQWTIDPVDGTEGFSKHLVYAIGVCFMMKNIPKMCVIGVPQYKDNFYGIFVAEEGDGAKYSKNGEKFEPIYVSKQNNLTKVKMCHSLHYDKPWVVKFAYNLGINQLVQIDSMAKLCMVADGSADIYIKPIDKDHSFSWDFAPGFLLVKEAGGSVTDLKGNDISFTNEHMICSTPGLIASNGIIHEQIINRLEKEDL